jgi:hypothetical protein
MENGCLALVKNFPINLQYANTISRKRRNFGDFPEIYLAIDVHLLIAQR